MSEVPNQHLGQGLIDSKIVESPSNFIAGRPKAALLFWFFGGFRCGLWLSFVIPVIYKNRTYVEKMFICRLVGGLEVAFHLAVADDVFDGVLFCAEPVVLFPRDVLDEIWD